VDKRFERSLPLYKEEGLKKLNESKVIIFGIGGVGGHIVESLARSGVGELTLVDNDIVKLTNINRQIVALESTLGKNKVDVMKERVLDINPNAKVTAIKKFYLPENENEFDLSKYDYVIDAVDTMSAKISLVCNASELNVPIISAMGAGNKNDITKLMISDIYKTSADPLAKILRHELRKRGIKKLKVAYSTELPTSSDLVSEKKRATPSSNSYVPAAMGLLIASEVIKDLLNRN
jgi:tRNA A37 threonylcarbamoyladenosine dehydratase